MFKKPSHESGSAGRWLYLCSSLVMGVMSIAACATSNYGSLQFSPEASQVFDNNQLIPNYTYYFSGFQRIPNGIIGIDNNYRLRSSVWKPFELNPEVLNQLSYRMAQVYSLNPRGAWILDPEGHRVGIWYSSRNQTKIRIEKDRQIVVVAPEPPDLRGIP